MMALAHQCSTEIALVDAAERAMLTLPQAPCPVIHHFSPGLCIREVHMPANTFAVGHAQKFEHLNVVLKGAVAMLIEGRIEVVRAPAIFVGKPGRKVGYVLEDTVWQNVYPTLLTDPQEVELFFVEKSEGFEGYAEAAFGLEYALRQEDRDDFLAMLAELGVTAEEARAQTEDTADQIPMPEGWGSSLHVRRSTIEGQGMYSSAPAEKGDCLAPARLGGKRTPAGRYVNHSATPNARMEQIGGDIYLMASQNIEGSMGGSPGEEITVDYRQVLRAIRGGA